MPTVDWRGVVAALALVLMAVAIGGLAFNLRGHTKE
jgi:hypothetical protein